MSDACVSRGAFECVVRCPNVTVDVPFDASVTRATVRNARVSVGARATVAFDDATCTYGYDEAHTVDLRAGRGEVTIRDDHVAVRARIEASTPRRIGRRTRDVRSMGLFRTRASPRSRP